MKVPKNERTPERLLLIGSNAFAGIDSVSWADSIVPNIPDYDIVIASVPHMTEAFLQELGVGFFDGIKEALVQFLHSGGKLVILLSPILRMRRDGKYPEWVSNIDWCPLTIATSEEVGRSIVLKTKSYNEYLSRMHEWFYHITIPRQCLTRELTKFYGLTHNTKYNMPIVSYLENRYSRVLAGECQIEVKTKRQKTNDFGTYEEYPKIPDYVTGKIVLLPLIDGMTPEEALLDILKEEMGYSLKSPEPDWAQKIEIPSVPDLEDEISKAQFVIESEEQRIVQLTEQVGKLTAFRRLLYSSGVELEDVVQKSFELFGGKISPAKYAQEEYILEFDDEEFLMEVKGVSKSIALKHLRQLNDYLLKFQEDTGKECKGILLGNAWRNVPPKVRNAKDTPEFPDNVVNRAEQWGISLVSSLTLFDAVLKVLSSKAEVHDILRAITTANGIVKI